MSSERVQRWVLLSLLLWRTCTWSSSKNRHSGLPQQSLDSGRDTWMTLYVS